MAKAYFEGERPIRFAHRGGAGQWPENTAAAFEGAMSLGIRWMETDVHCTRDGEVVLFHDDRVDRTTDGFGPVSSFAWSELEKLDAGARFVNHQGEAFGGRGIRVMRLHEALDLGPDIRWNLEIKQEDPPMIEALFRVLADRGVWERVLVASANDALVRAFRDRAGPRVATSAGTKETVAFFLSSRLRTARLARPRYDALQVPHRWPVLGRVRTVVDERFVEVAHQAGLQVHVWTIDDPVEMRHLVGLGVDAIMSDLPEVLVAELPG